MIKTTHDRNKFKKALGNRKIEEKHVSELIKKIKKNDLGIAYPILVDKSMRVIDGQHRLEARARLELPIHYVETDRNDTLDIIWDVNTSQKKWTTNNYVDLQAAQGNLNFVKLKRFADGAGITPSIALRLSDKRLSRHRLQAFKYTDSFDKHASEVIAIADLFNTKINRSNALLGACQFIRKLPDYSYNDFLSIKMSLCRLGKEVRMVDYVVKVAKAYEEKHKRSLTIQFRELFSGVRW